MNLWRSMGGMVNVVLTSADVHGALEMISKYGITVQDVIYVDRLHLRFSVRNRDIARLTRLAKKRGETVKILRQRGLFFAIRGLLARPVLTIGVTAILLFSCWVPTRIFFVRVEGNSIVSARQIIENAQMCGIEFGAARREVRSERIKNKLLESMPQLQWAGVNTYGCTAVITVRERNDLNEEKEEIGVSSIVALRDGVIREITVLQGNSLCQVGQAVKADQILVSGYTDCGICIRATQAKAEIFGETRRYLSAICPTEYSQRLKLSDSAKKYSLIIGKKRINLFKGSGISGGTCAKIYEEKYLTLPGGFVLPLAIACEQLLEYDTEEKISVSAEAILSDFTAWYLPQQMLEGKICHSAQVYAEGQCFYRLDGIYNCYEMIGVTRPEESIEGYE